MKHPERFDTNGDDLIAVQNVRTRKTTAKPKGTAKKVTKKAVPSKTKSAS